eukprot:jgi/Chlat1/267/Chrsp1S03160
MALSWLCGVSLAMPLSLKLAAPQSASAPAQCKQQSSFSSSRPLPLSTGRRRRQCYPTRASSSNEDQATSSSPSQVEPAVPSAAQPASSSSGGGAPPGKLIAGAAAGFAVAAFATIRVLGGGPTLATLAASAVPFDVALQNGRPTVVEFYADWCEACKELAPEVYRVEKSWADKVNFVMLNIDNPKWTPEMDEYNVDGIPHFVFLNDQGKEAAEVVGKLPRSVLEANVEALATGETQLPYNRLAGRQSSLSSRPVVRQATSADPRAHGGV